MSEARLFAHEALLSAGIAAIAYCMVFDGPPFERAVMSLSLLAFAASVLTGSIVLWRQCPRGQMPSSRSATTYLASAGGFIIVSIAVAIDIYGSNRAAAAIGLAAPLGLVVAPWLWFHLRTHGKTPVAFDVVCALIIAALIDWQVAYWRGLDNVEVSIWARLTAPEVVLCIYPITLGCAIGLIILSDWLGVARTWGVLIAPLMAVGLCRLI